MSKECSFVCVLSFSAVNTELQTEKYSYADQLPVSEIIHQVRDSKNHGQLGTIINHMKMPMLIQSRHFQHPFVNVQHVCYLLCLMRRQVFISAPVFLLFEVCPHSSLIWTQNRKLCSTSSNRFFVSFPWWQQVWNASTSRFQCGGATVKSSRMGRQDCGEELCIHLIPKWIVAFSRVDLHKWTPISPHCTLEHVLWIQNRRSWVLYLSCKIFHYEPIKNTISILPLQLVR